MLDELRVRIEARLAELPEVDPGSHDLHDLRQWFLALKHLGGITDEESEHLLEISRRVFALPDEELTEDERGWKNTIETLAGLSETLGQKDREQQ